MMGFIQSVVDWYLAHINYLTVMLLMAIESSFIPFPSEIIIPPAAYMAAQGKMNIILVVLMGSVGALIGALFNYFLAVSLGRKIIYSLANTKLAHLMLIDQKGVEKAEKYFNDNGKSSTLVGRFVPAIRQLISIPAGLSRMNMRDFIIYTVIGSTAWNILLALLGYFLYSQKDLLNKYYHELSIGAVFLGVAFIGYLVYKAFGKKKDVKKV